MEEKLREAACFGDLDGLIALLNQGASVNSQHAVNGWTALHWAAKRNNLSCVEALLSRGADRMVYTSKGELAAHLTTNKGVLQVLGYSGQHTRERQKVDKDKHRHLIEQGNSGGGFTPNYLRHPPLNYKVDLSQVTPAKSSKMAPSFSPNTPSASSTLPRQDQLSVAQVQKARSSNDLGAGGDDDLNSVRILKIRLVGREEYDRDFIEVDMPVHCLSFRRLVDVVCEEFSIDPNSIVKIRKLPNTRLRRDAEIQRLRDYQELEVETANAEESNGKQEEHEEKDNEKATENAK